MTLSITFNIIKIVEEWLSLALIQCSKCGKDISDQAIKCVHCGAYLKEKPGNNKLILIGVIIFIIIVGGSLYFYFKKDSHEPKTPIYHDIDGERI